MSLPTPTPFTFVDRLQNLAATRGAAPALRFWQADGVPLRTCSFAELDGQARGVAAALQDRQGAGERALLVFPSGLDYVAAFFGCLYAGCIAVPAAQPESFKTEHLARLLAMVKDATPRFLLTDSTQLPGLLALQAGTPELAGLEVLAVDQLDNHWATQWQAPLVKARDLAFLQYTSGSTSTPKGVMVSHGNLFANEQAIQRGFGIDAHDRIVSWLPLYHDMGLIGSLLQGVHSGIEVTLLTPRQFLEKPLRWLETIQACGGTISGGPDFAFRLCVERVRPEALASLDLSGWRLAFSGSEPIRAATLQAFSEKFAPCGFAAEALFPCYGLAEATLFVSAGQRGAGVRSESFERAALAQGQARVQESAANVDSAVSQVLVGCGRVAAEHQVRIVGRDSLLALPEGQVGEICYAGASVARGYWRNPTASAATFVEAEQTTFLRTGDLGFLLDNELFISGRCKDLIIVRGQNLYPQDLEQSLEDQLDVLRKGRIAAFPVRVDGQEGIGIAAEVSRSMQKLIEPDTIFKAIRATLAEAHQEPASVILLLQPGTLPKTTSGKLQRSACQQLWENGSADIYAQFPSLEAPVDAIVAAAPLSEREACIATLWQQLLRVPTVLPEDSFFALGGSSVTALQGLAQLQEELGVRLEPRLLFEAPTLRAFAAALERALQTSAHLDELPGVLPGVDQPLSLGQQRLWFHAQLEPQSSAYHIAATLALRGVVQLPALQQAFAQLFQRHASLRSYFVEQAGEPVTRYWAAHAFDVTVSEWPSADLVELQRHAETDFRRPFALDREPLLRVQVFQGAAGHSVLALNLHHSIADGLSMQVLIDEFAQLYSAACAGHLATLPTPALAYADFAAWQRAYLLQHDEGARQLAYWRERLGTDNDPLELPYDFPRPAHTRLTAARYTLQLPGALTARLQALAAEHGATLFMLLLAAYQALLQRASGHSDIRVGVPVANRPRQGWQRTVGFFVNTLVLRAEVHGRDNFTTLLAQVRAALIDAQAHQDLPFEQVVDALQVQRNLGHNPLFQVAFNHQQHDLAALQQLPGLECLGLQRWLGDSAFDLSLDSELQADGGLTLTFTYAEELFRATRIEQIGKCFSRLLTQLPARAAQPLATLEWLSAAEQAQLSAWGEVPNQVPALPLVPQALADQAQLRPDAIALVCGAQSLTYAELERGANRLAQHLLRLGVGRETLVGVALERSLELVLAPLAVLKSGGAYVPLDPAYPAERLAYMVEDAGLRWVLTDSRLNIAWPENVMPLYLDRLDLSIESSVAPDVEILPEQLAYLIYTSGSTGQPKGVAVSHGPLSQHCRAAGELYEMTEADVALHFASISFDGAVEQWLTPMLFGARLVLRGAGIISAEQSYRTLIDEQISIAYFPTSYAHQLAEWVQTQGLEKPTQLRSCTIGGEAVSRETFDLLRSGLGVRRIINGYGPTETIVTPTLWRADAEATCVTPYAPIGKAVGQRTLYVLDTELNLVPPGAAGELYIGGLGLARGYFQRPNLTAERFIPDPFSVHGGRLYRTGDRVRWLADGNLEYLGRIDQQVKLRGYRIELGEIEAALQSQAEVGEAVVVLRDKRLVGYVVAEQSEAFGETLRERLKNQLPDYMVPSRIMVLVRLPLSPNGKVDRRALPEPVWESQGFVAPQTPAEQSLAMIWQQVLGLSQVGIHDNFFELGGDSIVSIQVVSRARQQGWALTPKDLFQHQTLQALAQVAEPITGASQINQGPVIGDAPLTPIQTWFFEQAIEQRQHWNQSVLLKAAQPLDQIALNCALTTLIEHHDALRLSWHQYDGQWLQTHREIETANVLWSRTAKIDEITPLCDQAQASLNLENGPVLRALHLTLEDGSARLLLAIHHLVIDGVSWRILLDDLQTAYSQALAGKTPQLPPKTTSYKTWAQALNTIAEQGQLQHELAYWQTTLAGQVDQFPQDGQGETGSHSLTQTFNREQTQQLLKTANVAYRTRLDDLLLTALTETLCEWSGQESVLIDLEGHGREELELADKSTAFEADLTRTVGWFTSLYPVRLHRQKTLIETLKANKEHLRQIPNKGVGFGVLKYLAKAPELQDFSAAQVTFNYLGQFDLGAEALLSLATEAGGRLTDPAQQPLQGLEINAQILSGELRLDWHAAAQRYSRATLHALQNRFKTALHALLAMCLEPGIGGPTPSDFPLLACTQTQLDGLAQYGDIEDVYPLTPMQQGILFHALQEPQADAYFYQRCFVLDGALDSSALLAAWAQIAARYPVLRSAYFWEETTVPCQAVFRDAQLAVHEEDWRGQSPTEQQAKLQQWLDVERHQGFAFAQGHHLRLGVLRVTEQRWWMVWSSHHIALDGWSMGLILRDLLDLYHDRPTALGALASRPYADYVAWLQRQSTAVSTQFWREYLADWHAPTPLPGRSPEGQSSADASEYAEQSLTLDCAATAALRAAAQRLGVTLNTLLQGAWALSLGAAARSTEVLFGITLSGRSLPLAGIEDMVGLFINTLPLRVALPGELGVGAWLQALQAANVRLREGEHCALAEVQRAVATERNERGGLFESILVFENYPLDAVLREQPAGLRLALLEEQHAAAARRGRNNYPLSLIAQLDESLRLTLAYRTAEFTTPVIGALLERLGVLLPAMARRADEPLQNLFNLAAPSETPTTPAQWHGEARKFAGCTVLEAWAAQLAADPQAPVVSDEGRSLCRSDLEVAANRVAHALQAQGLGAEQVVGLCVQPSADSLIGLLGILKAGAVYLPLDPQQPAPRLQAILADSGATGLLWHAPTASLAADLNAAGRVSLALDGAHVAHAKALAPSESVLPEQAAYVIYTSGSTGQPKGVVVEHAALHHYAHAVLERLRLPAGSSLALVSTAAADLGHTQVFAALCGGHELVIPALERRFDAHAFAEYLHERRVAVLKIVPSHLRGLLQANPSAQVLPQHLLILGGEASDSALLAQIRALRPDLRIVNHYGPSETTVGVLTWELPLDATPETLPAHLPLGLPLANLHLRIVDPEGDIDGPAVASGELWIGGACLARGYLGRPQETAERFRHDASGQRWYRTGDRVHACAQGLVFVGRVDEQVKVRGYRVELGEVVQHLRRLPGVADAAAHVQAPSAEHAPRLLGYVVPQPGLTLDHAALLATLSQHLPDYLVPARLYSLANLPLNANGKLDRRALPVTLETASAATPFNAPQGAVEELLASIWQNVLKCPRVGRDENFFALGGDSILSLQIIAQARKQGLKLTPKKLFAQPTIAELAVGQQLNPPTPNAIPSLPTIAREGLLPLAPAQQRLWFLASLAPLSSAYTIAGALVLRGRVDVTALRRVFERLSQRHEMLRASFHAEQGQPRLRIAAERTPEWQTSALPGAMPSSAEVQTRLAAFQARPFDLSAEPLWRVQLLDLGADCQVLQVCLHHLIADGWSLGILIDELNVSYRAACAGTPAPLPSLTYDYLDEVASHTDAAARREQHAHLDYWRTQLPMADAPLALPYDFPIPQNAHGQGAQSLIELDTDLQQGLRQLAATHACSVFHVLMAAFAQLLQRYSGQADIRIGMPVSGRDRPQSHGLVGCLVNTLVVRLDLHAPTRLGDLLSQARDQVQAAQAHGSVPFEHLVEALVTQRQPGVQPLFQVVHNHQRRDAAALQLGDLAVERLDTGARAAQFELVLDTEEGFDGSLHARLLYATERFAAPTVERLAQHWLTLLRQWVATPEQPLARMQLTDVAERAQLQAWSQAQRQFENFVAAPQRIAEHALCTPQAVALRYQGDSLTYDELERRANRLAHKLIALGVGAEVLVGVALPRSFDLIVALLAVLKSGGAYVPLDPDYPAERLAYIAGDCGLKLVLGQHDFPVASGVQLLALDRLDLSAESDAAPLVEIVSDQLAYVIYTSGSTGQPKGAQLTHGNLARLFQATADDFKFAADDVWTLFHSYAFDFSVWEIFGALLHGARLVIVPYFTSRAPDEFAKLLVDEGVTVLNQTPSAFRPLVNELTRKTSTTPLALRWVIFGGEALEVASLKPWFERYGDQSPRLINMYGITETTVHVTFRPITRADLQRQGPSPIGRPLADLGLYVLDADLNPQPIGVPGELYVSGAGLARGYLNRPALNAERFIASPFAANQRLYRSGDLARRVADGSLEYLGRLDQQVKIRGFRIELGEIEARLLEHPAVREAAVVVQESAAGPRLIGYVASDLPVENIGVDLQETLRAHLHEHLPDYMVPVRILALNSLPLTANGKLDRRALPAPEQIQNPSYREPQTRLQQGVAQIWAELLGVARVGLDDDFFALGGHSLLATQVVALVQQRQGQTMQLRTLFEASTLERFCAALDARPGTSLDTAALGRMADLLTDLEMG